MALVVFVSQDQLIAKNSYFLIIEKLDFLVLNNLENTLSEKHDLKNQ